MAVYQDCSNKSPWFKIDLGPGVYIQVNDFRAIMALLFMVNIIIEREREACCLKTGTI
jgi:hypothetical protein